MAIIGFSFIKFDCERKSNQAKGSIEIKHNVSITKVEKTSITVGSNKNDVLKINFGFDVIYSNDIGKVSIAGDVVFTDTPEIITETQKSWDLDKKLPALVNEQIHGFIYNKAIVRALELSDSLNLPSPIPMPKVSFKSQE